MSQSSLAQGTRLEEPASPAEGLRRLILPAMFWRPAYLPLSAWLEHVPFAFWLIDAMRPRVVVELGTHNGGSYFAFCQAVDRLGLDTRCFAVDSWKGDAHSGFYSEEVFTTVSSYNNNAYSAFSRLVRSDFDQAAAHFQSSSIDLLHIDGLHTLERVRHDFETWLPKLSDKAVVLLHDTNVRERGFGVSVFFEELRRSYPCFEFVHGHGLGVVQVGRKAAPAVAALTEADRDPALRQAVWEAFGRLGRAVADSRELGLAAEGNARHRLAIAERDRRVEALEASLETAAREQAAVAEKDRRISELEQKTAALARALEVALLRTGAAHSGPRA